MDTKDIFEGKHDISIDDLKQRLRGLTRREREVLNLVARGQRTKEVARTLGMAPKTTAVHRQHILLKLNATNFTQVVWMMGRTSDTDTD